MLIYLFVESRKQLRWINTSVRKMIGYLAADFGRSLQTGEINGHSEQLFQRDRLEGSTGNHTIIKCKVFLADV